MEEYKITWIAQEYEHREHSADWYWAVGIISVALAIAFVIIGNTLLSLILLLGVGTLFHYSKNPPREVEYELSKKGVRAGKTLYPWTSLSSFWILEGLPDAKHHRDPKILFTPTKPFLPHIIIPINEDVMEEAHHSLSNMLPEEEQFEPFHERIIRVIGF